MGVRGHTCECGCRNQEQPSSGRCAHDKPVQHWYWRQLQRGMGCSTEQAVFKEVLRRQNLMFQTGLYSSEEEMLLHSWVSVHVMYIYIGIYICIQPQQMCVPKNHRHGFIWTRTFTQNRAFIHLCLSNGLHTGQSSLCFLLPDISGRKMSCCSLRKITERIT